MEARESTPFAKKSTKRGRKPPTKWLKLARFDVAPGLTPREIRDLTILVPLTALAAACVSPDGPFTAVGTPVMPLHEARAHCKENNRSVSDDGTVVTNWNAYEQCMADLGWVKQSTPGSAGPGPTGGGRPSY